VNLTYPDSTVHCFFLNLNTILSRCQLNRKGVGAVNVELELYPCCERFTHGSLTRITEKREQWRTLCDISSSILTSLWHHY
jgi:hypothetical protein